MVGHSLPVQCTEAAEAFLAPAKGHTTWRPSGCLHCSSSSSWDLRRMNSWRGELGHSGRDHHRLLPPFSHSGSRRSSSQRVKAQRTCQALPLHTSLLSSQFIIISSLLDQPPLVLFSYRYPEWSISVGYLIGASSFICIPVYMVFKLIWTPGSLKQVRSLKQVPYQQLDSTSRGKCTSEHQLLGSGLRLLADPGVPLFQQGPCLPQDMGWGVNIVGFLHAADISTRLQGGPLACHHLSVSLFLVLQRLAVCLRPEKTIQEQRLASAAMPSAP